MQTIQMSTENKLIAPTYRVKIKNQKPGYTRLVHKSLRNAIRRPNVIDSSPSLNVETLSNQDPQEAISTPGKYAVIVPCYNEENRFPYHAFLSFAQKHPEVLICFVNDGSTDKTLSVLRGIQAECPENIYVYSMKKNGGKSEAVRQGMLHMHAESGVPLMGFLDADLATLPEEWLQMAKYKEQYPEFGGIVGSRIQRLGAKINRDDSRSLFSSLVKKFIRIILRTRFQDTQCGAKIFHRSLVPVLFRNPFMTPWLFDVEIFLRLQEKFGKSTLSKGVLEFPLMHWTEVGDSRLKLKHTIKIPMQLLKLYYQYHLAGKFNKKNEIPFFTSANSPASSVPADKIIGGDDLDML